MDADQLLQSLGVSLNVPNLHFDANGCARLAIDGAPPLDFERGSGGVLHVYSVLGPLPPESREPLYAELLKGNLFGKATAGASLAVDFLYGEVVLCRTVATEHAAAHAFTAEIEAFVAAAEDWKRRLESAPEEPKVQPSRASFPAPQMMDHFLRG
jgi:hypothetical protein